jgi:hypothetical protein
MSSQDYKDEIIRYVLESSNEENENLAIFMAGMKAEKRVYRHEKPGKEEDTAPVIAVPPKVR